ncbi:MAG TPA: DUF6259 domain-containing protein [Gaiellaceae bacterium]|nr:DUF6259 domain-containing protein [Gaiellaceae bacterium]
MRRRANLGALAGALIVLAALAAFLGRPDSGAAFFVFPGGDPSAAGVSFDQSPATAIVLQTKAYKLTISKKNGELVSLVDRVSGKPLVDGTNGCEWGTSAVGDATYDGGCLFSPTGSSTFSYAWDPSGPTLTMTYTSAADAAKRVDAVVTLSPQPTFFDLRVTLTNHGSRILQTVSFPVDLFGDSTQVQAGYAPNFLPGVRFGPTFFNRVGNDVLTYPGRWEFADYLAVDSGGGHLAMYSVNPSPAPLAPVDLGFIHNAAPAPCSGGTFCITHLFHTWVSSGGTWTSPTVRLRVGEPVEQSIVDYRNDNGIAAYPSLADKLGSKLATLARAPLIKADLQKGTVPPFKSWPDALTKLPSPALIHPVAFGPNGFDATDPDVLPPDKHVGTTDDFKAAITAAHNLGDLVMPYLNVSWWNPESPTMEQLPDGLNRTSVSVQDSGGNPVTEGFSGYTGNIVSPAVPFVRTRVQTEIDTWTDDVPADCLFFDQLGARPWRYDFNPAETSPLGYYDGWLSLFAPYANRCLMVEDGWDRLAASFSSFDSSLMLMQREFDWLDVNFGPDWTTFPLALWLVHDKVLTYQHDLFDGTFTADPEMLQWNLAYGYMLSYNWNAGLDGPWLGIDTAFQQALGPHYAGVALTSYTQLADGVTQTQFDTYSVIANWNGSPYAVDGQTIAPHGFLARTDDGSLVAGEFADPSGSTYRIVQNGQTAFQTAVP